MAVDVPFTNPTPSYSSSNPTGAGTTLSPMGESRIDGRASWGGWSGAITVNNSTVTALKFTAPNYNTILNTNFGYNAAGGTLSGDALGYIVEFNGVAIMNVIPRNTAGQNSPDFDVLRLPLPAQTEVEIKHYTTDTNAINTFMTVLLREM